MLNDTKARLREPLKRLLPRAQAVTERVGVRVEPLHYYSNIADRRWLRRHPAQWRRPLPMHDVEWDLDAQLDWLAALTAPYRDEVAGLGRYQDASAGRFGPGYGPIEAQVLHCFVRARVPRRVVEVGSGVSTATMVGAGAANADGGSPAPAITCIEPFPGPGLEALAGIEVLAQPCQAVPPEIFARLGPGDLLFIDSTHAVRTGSELPYLYLDIIPSLPAGVFVHIHDIYLPYPFSPTVLDDVFDWQETLLVAALLTGNRHLQVRCALSALHHDRPGQLGELLPDYRPAPTADGLVGGGLGEAHFPSSLWLETA